MPIRPFSVSLAQTGKTPIAEQSDKINSVSITDLGATGRFRIEFGRGQSTSPITTRGRLKFPRIVDNPDAREGAFIVVDVAQPGLSVAGFVSYQRDSDPPSEGIDYLSAS